MGETFYGVLGVATDADTEAIRRAYRDRVKEYHPDVSDRPDAPERFKRVTTARDVLVDTEKRDRYDRLGHDEYVARFVDSGGWTDAGESADRTQSSDSTGRTGNADSYDRTDWLGENARRDQRERRHRRRQGAGTGRTVAAERWQHASDAYRRADTDIREGRWSTIGRLLAGLRTVGPWLFVHLVFVGSAVATSWLAFSQLAVYVDLSWPVVALGVSFVGATLLVSVLHVVSQVYS